MNGYNDKCRQFIGEYAKEARKSGVVIEGKIANPTEQNLSYYEEIMGMDFQMSMGFLLTSLKKWLPRMNDYQRKCGGSILRYVGCNAKRGQKREYAEKCLYQVYVLVLL